MTNLADLKARLLQDAEVRDEYEAQASEFALAQELIAARTRAGLSQAEVAQRMGTSQSTIARLEGGRTLPSLRTLERYARATGCKALVRLVGQQEAGEAGALDRPIEAGHEPIISLNDYLHGQRTR